MTLLEKARSGRRAALASLAANDHGADNVVSIFDFAKERDARLHPAKIPAFHSIRSDGNIVRIAA